MLWKGFRNQIQTLVTPWKSCSVFLRLFFCSAQNSNPSAIVSFCGSGWTRRWREKQKWLISSRQYHKGTHHGSCCFSWVFYTGRCGNGALVNNDDARHETKSSQFEREVVSLLQVVITVVWSVKSWNFFSMTNHNLHVFSLSLDTWGKKRALSSRFNKKN